jgi:hypothetical protein
MADVVLIPTGKLEHAALGRALLQLFPGNVFRVRPDVAPQDGFTSVPRPGKSAAAKRLSAFPSATAARGPARPWRFLQAIFSGCRAGIPVAGSRPAAGR